MKLKGLRRALFPLDQLERRSGLNNGVNVNKVVFRLEWFVEPLIILLFGEHNKKVSKVANLIENGAVPTVSSDSHIRDELQ